MKAHFDKCDEICLERESLANGHSNNTSAASDAMVSHSLVPTNDQTELDNESEPHSEVLPTPQIDPSSSGATSIGEGEQLLHAFLADQSDPSPIDATPIGEGEQLSERPPTAHADPLSVEVASRGEVEENHETLLMELIGDLTAGYESIIEGPIRATPLQLPISRLGPRPPRITAERLAP